MSLVNNKKSAVLVLGYNNTRVNDVKTIRNKSAELLSAVTVLCKKNPIQQDFLAADYVIDVGLAGNSEDVQIVKTFLETNALNAIALLPFSDPGTQLGAALAKELTLLGPDINSIKGALDKYTFRQLESKADDAPVGYKKVKSEIVTSLDQLQNIYTELDGKVFLKPAQEGNSRGCINLNVNKNLEAAWKQLEPYLSGGVVAEELIPHGPEYSWDHVNGFSWVTEQRTTQDEYRGQYQQIVPAPIDENKSAMLAAAGKFMAQLVGSNNGACHNEIFIFNDNNVAGVEPNLRPAGIRIWDLAAYAFDGFNPWEEWILWASNSKKHQERQLKHNYYAGVRCLKALASGVLKNTSDIKLDDILMNSDVEMLELVWLKKQGDEVSHIARDNSDYIGYIILRSKSYEKLSNALEQVSAQIEKIVKIKAI